MTSAERIAALEVEIERLRHENEDAMREMALVCHLQDTYSTKGLTWDRIAAAGREYIADLEQTESTVETQRQTLQAIVDRDPWEFDHFQYAPLRGERGTRHEHCRYCGNHRIGGTKGRHTDACIWAMAEAALQPGTRPQEKS